MRVLDNLFGPQLNNLENALSRTTQRHALLSNNLANVNTPGYQREDIDFNITLQDQMGDNSPSPAGAQASSGGAVRLDGNGVDMEKEVMSMAETEMHYQALTNMTVNYFTNLKNVIREGK